MYVYIWIYIYLLKLLLVFYDTYCMVDLGEVPAPKVRRRAQRSTIILKTYNKNAFSNTTMLYDCPWKVSGRTKKVTTRCQIQIETFCKQSSYKKLCEVLASFCIHTFMLQDFCLRLIISYTKPFCRFISSVILLACG